MAAAPRSGRIRSTLAPSSKPCVPDPTMARISLFRDLSDAIASTIRRIDTPSSLPRR